MQSDRIEMGIGMLPGRKREALYLTIHHAKGGASIRPLAYFRSSEAYQEFKEALDGRALYLEGTDTDRGGGSDGE